MMRRTVALLVSTAAMVLPLSACGSDSSADAGDATADLAAAQQVLAPYTGQPGPFPVDVALTKRPAGATFGYLQCVTPVCGLIGQLTKPAADTLGVSLQVAQADTSATSMQSALDSLITSKVDAVLLPAIEPSTVTQELKTLQDQDIPTSANGIMDAQDHGITADMFNNATAEIAGQLQAAWVVKNHDGDSRPVFYRIPELSFTDVEQTAFLAEMKTLCPDCTVRTKDVSVATIGSTAPSQIVADLQANPDDNVAVFSSEEMATGLPAAMRVASLSTDTIGFGPSPANLQDIKTGGLTAGIGLDIPVMVWSQVDAAARIVTGQDLSPGEQKGIPPLQVLEKKDITFDPSEGWTGYPDFAERFAKLWAGQN